jgi:predicted phosphodiesterase
VVYGHSHIAFQQEMGNILFFNPGAAGKRRFKVVPSIGFLELADGRVDGKIVSL